MNFETLYTGLGMGCGMAYLAFQFFSLREIKQWRSFLDLGLFILMMIMFFKVGSGYMAAVTTWAGLTVSIILRLSTVFVSLDESEGSSKELDAWTKLSNESEFKQSKEN